MNQIKEINLSNNKIDTIENGAFYIMRDYVNYGKSMVVLDLSYNKISSESFISSEFIVNWPQGFVPLDFSYNSITTFPENVWRALTATIRYN